MKHIRLVANLVALLIIIASITFYFKFYKTSDSITLNKDNFKNFIDNNALRPDPRPLHNYFLTDVKENKNDKFTQSAAYWLSHRYYDNGGNIYEIQEYIEKYPELAFLNEAKQIYPNSFEFISKNSSPTYNVHSNFVYYAYLEILDKYGYLGLPGLSTLANKYAESANDIKKRGSMSTSTLAFYKKVLDKSLKYEEKARSGIIKIIKSGDVSEFASINDAVVGLAQYANALQLYKALGLSVKSDYTGEGVYVKAEEYAKNTTLNYFVNYQHASSYITTGEISAEKIKTPLSVISNSSAENLDSKGFLYKIITSKTSGGQGIYSYENTKTLAKYSPEFKVWLKNNGWIEQDF